MANVASAGLRAWPSAQDFRGLVAEPAGAVRGTAIVFHGNADPVFSVLDTVNWYQKLDANNKGAAQSFVKFYRIPGMPHGAGGPSYDDFDFFSPLVDWVEKGTAPQGVSAGITQKNSEAKALIGARYLYCPYPQVSRVKTSSTGEKERTCQ